MIKIDFYSFIKEYMWFGFSYNERADCILTTDRRIGKTNWVYSQWWTLRLWPVRLNGKILPDWYIAIFDYCGYIDKNDDGIE